MLLMIPYDARATARMNFAVSNDTARGTLLAIGPTQTSGAAVLTMPGRSPLIVACCEKSQTSARRASILTGRFVEDRMLSGHPAVLSCVLMAVPRALQVHANPDLGIAVNAPEYKRGPMRGR